MSTMRFYPTISQKTKFQRLTTPSYFDNTVGEVIPIPFIYENNSLDINIQDNVQVDCIDAGITPDQDTNPQCKTFGGTGLVLRLGPKLIEWLTNWLTNNYGPPISNIAIHTSGLMIKAQYPIQSSDFGTFLGSDVDNDTYAITSVPPSGDEYVGGDSSNNYRAVWIFKTPLTISFTENANQRFLTLFTNYAGND